jgi:two-component system sensor histidine kinase BaeS
MKLRITYKLLLAFLLTNVTVIVLMAVLMRWNFARGFLHYIHETEVRRLDSLVTALAQTYAEQGNWRFLRHNPRRWRQILHAERFQEAEEAVPTPPDEGTPLHPPPGAPPPNESRRTVRRSASPRLLPPPYHPDDPLSLRLRLSVLDEDKQVVIGSPRGRQDDTLRPIMHAGHTVGWLRIAPLQTITNELDRRFLAQQSRAFVLITTVSIALAAGVSMLLAHHLLAPVRHLARGTRALAAGQFATRIQVRSGDELGQLATDFNLLAHTLEKNEHIRRQLTADISHELRTPLAILRGEIEALQDGIRPCNADTLQSLYAEVMRLNTLVDDLYELSLSDLGALHYRKATIDLVEVLDEALTACRDRFASQDITVEAAFARHPPVLVFADPERLRQLLTNLFENTLRYTDPGGQLRVWYTRHEKAVILHFQDSAPGVPAEALPQLFDRFYRVEASRTRSQGGAGLGLAICKNIVEAHGGEISAQPSPLGGVWIQVTLPVSA